MITIKFLTKEMASIRGKGHSKATLSAPLTFNTYQKPPPPKEGVLADLASGASVLYGRGGSSSLLGTITSILMLFQKTGRFVHRPRRSAHYS